MQITSETDYAVRCVLHLSKKNGEVLMINEIARDRNIPQSFLAKILQKLTKAGIVRSYRGVKGGFAFTKKPSSVSLLDVIEAIEGPLSINKCVINNKKCSFSKTCSVHPAWIDIKRDMEIKLRNWTFKKLLLTEK